MPSIERYAIMDSSNFRPIISRARHLRRGLDWGRRRKDKQQTQEHRHCRGKPSHSTTMSAQGRFRNRLAERLGPERLKS
jgi:hypothetical protein